MVGGLRPAVYQTSSGRSWIFKQGVADLTQQYRNNGRQSGLCDSFVYFLNFKLKYPKEGVASHPIHPPGSAPDLSLVKKYECTQ